MLIIPYDYPCHRLNNCIPSAAIHAEAIVTLERAVSCGDTEGVASKELARLLRSDGQVARAADFFYIYLQTSLFQHEDLVRGTTTTAGGGGGGGGGGALGATANGVRVATTTSAPSVPARSTPMSPSFFGLGSPSPHTVSGSGSAQRGLFASTLSDTPASTGSAAMSNSSNNSTTPIVAATSAANAAAAAATALEMPDILQGLLAGPDTSRRLNIDSDQADALLFLANYHRGIGELATCEAYCNR